ncbi:MAG: hypothetical protein ABIJ37_10620 [Pseudomonadota bacterium]
MIEFKSISSSSSMLNPLKGFEEDRIWVETRYDPLLGERCDLCHLAFAQFQLERVDLNPIIEKSLERPWPILSRFDREGYSEIFAKSFP